MLLQMMQVQCGKMQPAAPTAALKQFCHGPQESVGIHFGHDGPNALRQDHRPMISDLRESGSIEQDADMVILLYRAAVYDETAGTESEAIVAKNRHGPIETCRLVFQGEDTRFRTLAEEE